jgi:hypothetical protein
MLVVPLILQLTSLRERLTLLCSALSFRDVFTDSNKERHRSLVRNELRPYRKLNLEG